MQSGGQKKGTLQFLDDGKRFDSAMPALQRLSERGCDVSVYSMVPAGQKAPGRLIIRVTLPGCLNTYWDRWKTKPHERCIALEIVDYEETDPASIAEKACALREKVYARASALLKGASVCTVCIGTDEADIQAYFSLDAAPDTPNANTYRFDKHHFLDAVPVVHKSAPRLDAGETCVSAIRAMARRPRTFRNELVLAPDIVTDVTNMGALFESFQKITHLDLSPLSTAGVTNMGSMFQACQSLEELDCSAFDTSAVTDMSDMFCQCSRLRKLNLSSFDVRRVTDMSRMFSECRSLAELNLSGFDTAQVTSMQRMFGSCSALETLNLSSFNTSRVTNMVGMFSFCKKLKEIDLSSFDTSNVTNMRSLFWGCEQMVKLNLSSLNTARVTNMNYMFSGCKSLKRLDLSSFDTSHVTSMFEMFEDCESLEELNLSAWNTSQVEDMHRMFTGCRRLKKLDLSSFDFRSVQDMQGMFHDCTSLQEVILSDTLLQAPVQIERVIKEGRTYTEEVLGEGNTPSHAYENRYIATITEGRETKNISIGMATEQELCGYLALGEHVKMTFGRPSVQKKLNAPQKGFWQKLFSGFEQR